MSKAEWPGPQELYKVLGYVMFGCLIMNFNYAWKIFWRTLINTLQDNEWWLVKGSHCVEEFDDGGGNDEIRLCLIKTTR